MTKKAQREYEERLAFLNTYDEFDQWLRRVGYKCVQSSTTSDFQWSHYDKLVDPLYSVEYYQHPVLKMDMRFLRDKNEHKLVFVGGGMFGEHSEATTLEDAKTSILAAIITTRDKALQELQPLMDLESLQNPQPPPLEIVNEEIDKIPELPAKPPKFNLRPLAERLVLMKARHNSVPHWEEQVRMYERFRNSDPINGHRRWQEEVRKAKQQLQRVITLKADTKLGLKHES